MSHFEYVAVAFSLVFALILARLLESLPSVFAKERRYWVHSLWVVHLIFSVLGVWWALWAFRDAKWTPILFLEVMFFPMILYMRTVFLLQDRNHSRGSWESLFYKNRNRFFASSALAPVAALLFDLSISESTDGSRWLRVAGFGFVLSLNILGLISSDPRVHAAIVLVVFVLGLGWLAGGTPA
jgi:uncharacterized membrane protein